MKFRPITLFYLLSELHFQLLSVVSKGLSQCLQDEIESNLIGNLVITTMSYEINTMATT